MEKKMFGREKEKTSPAPQTATSSAPASSSYAASAVARPAIGTDATTPKIETIIGANCRFSGTLQSDGGVRIDGIFEGTLHTTGNVVVSESATVIAELQVYNVTISGAMKGNITANKVEITESGKLWGDLNINTILLHEGAYHEGQTNMANAVAPPTIEPPRLGRMPQLGSSGKPARDSDS
jgi:cytoskeletal protein CcmA (bactofilin family)